MQNPTGATEQKQPDQNIGVHPDVVKLGLVSMLTDLSSEMIFSVFAIFFTSVAGASTALLWLIEGCADLSASSFEYDQICEPLLLEMGFG